MSIISQLDRIGWTSPNMITFSLYHIKTLIIPILWFLLQIVT